MKGWFTIDLLAIIPFDQIMEASNANEMVRITRIGRIYRLVKLTRLVRVMKIMKDKSKFMKLFSDFNKIGSGFERLSFFMLFSLVMIHIVTCLWIIIPGFVVG